MRDIHIKKPKITLEGLFLSLLLIFSTFGQRIVIPLGGQQMALIFPVTIAFFLIMLFSRKFSLYTMRLLLFTLFWVLALSFLLFQEAYSATSILFLLMLYLPFLFKFEFEDELKLKYLKRFQNIVLFTAFFGIFQFASQAAGMTFTDPLSVLPSNLIQLGYNTTYPITYGSPISKPNGGFYLEPSLFSQFLAVSIIIEVLFFKRWTRVFILFVAIVTSFSGTGLTILMILGVPLLFKLKFKQALAVIVAGTLVAIVFFNSEYGSVTSGRADEYNSQNSSFSIRFINPFETIFLDEQKDVVIGHGPGQTERTQFPFEANFTAIPKLWYEYGFLPMIIFMMFLMHCIFSRNITILTAAIFIMYTFLSGSLLQPQTIYFTYFMLIISRFTLTEELAQKTQPVRKVKRRRRETRLTLT
ncbi:hypothetical protein COE67_04835 [Priestia megaterium]|uniref:hypothetical protein n=2 Tax=Priestia megaterium TaxID=1404 RepID=UPI000BFB8123|nr:hypothetical protein [Priestia megaterium]PGX44275.1 hypothetical protein COE67_04835 [Priestia megaterium]